MPLRPAPQEALLDAKVDIAGLRGSKTGVYIGAGWVDSLARSKGKEELTGPRKGY